MSYVSANEIYSDGNLSDAHYYRQLALQIDKNPNDVHQYKHHHSFINYLSSDIETCVARTKKFECLSYGDVGVLLAAPGPSLAGLMVEELGNPEQQSYFKTYLNAHLSQTFLAVTEPARGSDAANLTTQLVRKGNGKYSLTGEKKFIGNGARGDIGVVIARLSSGPLGLVAVLLTPDQSLKREVIPTTGLKGASLSQIYFDDYEVTQDQLLGMHLRIANRGLMGLMKTFNRMRTCVGALAIGLSQAMLDEVFSLKSALTASNINQLVRLSSELSAARSMLYQAAKLIDEDVLNSAAASCAKVIATNLCEKIANQIINMLPINLFWDYPLIEKWYRDSFGFEYMEGTTAIHHKNIAQAYLNSNSTKILAC